MILPIRTLSSRRDVDRLLSTVVWTQLNIAPGDDGQTLRNDKEVQFSLITKNVSGVVTIQIGQIRAYAYLYCLHGTEKSLYSISRLVLLLWSNYQTMLKIKVHTLAGIAPMPS